MFIIIGGLVIIISWVLAGYIGLYSMLIQPILNACAAFDTGYLTVSLMGLTIIKCLFATTVFSVIAYIGSIIGCIVMGFQKK